MLPPLLFLEEYNHSSRRPSGLRHLARRAPARPRVSPRLIFLNRRLVATRVSKRKRQSASLSLSRISLSLSLSLSLGGVQCRGASSRARYEERALSAARRLLCAFVDLSRAVSRGVPRAGSICGSWKLVSRSLFSQSTRYLVTIDSSSRDSSSRALNCPATSLSSKWSNSEFLKSRLSHGRFPAPQSAQVRVLMKQTGALRPRSHAGARASAAAAFPPLRSPRGAAGSPP